MRRVPLFYAHRLRMSGDKILEVGDERIKKIVDNINTVGRKAGRWPTMSEDHIVTFKDGKQVVKPSSDIRILGYTCNYDTDLLPDDNGNLVTWIVADCLSFPDEHERVKNLPYRSVEFHPSKDMITNVAFTKHTPQLEVGTLLPEHWERGYASLGGGPTGIATSQSRLVAYSADADGVVVYSMEGAMNNDAMLQGLSQLRKAVSDMIEKIGEPAPKPKEEETVVSYEAHPEFIKLREERDALLKEKETLNSTKEKLESEKRSNERRQKLVELSKTRRLDPEGEMKAWGDSPDEVFNRHLESITVSYAARSAGGATIEPLDGPGGQDNGDLMKKAKEITSRRIKSGDDSMQFHQVLEKCRTDPTWNG